MIELDDELGLLLGEVARMAKRYIGFIIGAIILGGSCGYGIPMALVENPAWWALFGFGSSLGIFLALVCLGRGREKVEIND